MYSRRRWSRWPGPSCAAAIALVLGAAIPLATGSATRAEEPPPFILGTVLPDTGALDSYGPATQQAVRLAVEDARDAGADVELVSGDSGDGVGTVRATIRRLRDQGVTAVVGPMSSRLLLDTLGEFGDLAVVSPSTASPLLTGRIARTAPSDALQGAALAKLAAQSRVVRLAIVAPRGDQALAAAAIAEAAYRGMETRLITFGARTSASKIAAQVSAAAADGVLLASSTETTSIVRELLRRGLPATVVMTASAGAGVDARSLPRQALRGARVLGPDLRVPLPLRERLAGVRKFDYAAQAYDAAAVAILAARQVIASGVEPIGPAIRAAIPAVTTGGTACRLAECLRLIGQGRDIDYQGFSGDVDLGPEGDPVVATFVVRTLGADNAPTGPLTYVRVP